MWLLNYSCLQRGIIKVVQNDIIAATTITDRTLLRGQADCGIGVTAPIVVSVLVAAQGLIVVVVVVVVTFVVAFLVLAVVVAVIVMVSHQ